jgi:hypothetical protein
VLGRSFLQLLVDHSHVQAFAYIKPADPLSKSLIVWLVRSLTHHALLNRCQNHTASSINLLASTIPGNSYHGKFPLASAIARAILTFYIYAEHRRRSTVHSTIRAKRGGVRKCTVLLTEHATKPFHDLQWIWTAV